ncbi:diguanylate cyclase (GGDEF) domain-containing protein [Pseudobutyrivibrio sp. ACV-2]|uniref:GGDEF domain-containing protein n=1 Tax=Pseudobutyrivibrio sp. ACV-2 TaxID=1520801 RepID=UPI00089690A3|nr:diguanylate cyclase [Pseudobutyrivibrio sp. ACV-2]SEB02300.1 diguanylate cyclase (GGDEF) domain-containing protein [Pseudobutyrivibrio sp. ACV-2]
MISKTFLRKHAYSIANIIIIILILIVYVSVQMGEMAFFKEMAARWGGDEFIGVIRASEDESKEIVEVLIGELKKAETQRTVTLSCGLVKVNPQLSFEKNMEKADEALYFSKSNGKGIVTVYKDIK